MSITLPALIAKAQVIAQDPVHTVPFLRQAGDYEQAVTLALLAFDADVPNRRIVHHTLTASAYRFVLSGAGALAELTGADAWVPGRSSLTRVWCPYSTTTRTQTPLDPQDWRVLDEPSLVLLELAADSPASGLLRLEFTRPHAVSETAASTSVRDGDVDALALLVACQILEMYAAGAIQNTGSTGFPSDVVNRQTASGEAMRRAADLRTRYKALVGVQPQADLKAAGAVFELDVQPMHGLGTLWWPRSLR